MAIRQAVLMDKDQAAEAIEKIIEFAATLTDDGCEAGNLLLCAAAVICKDYKVFMQAAGDAFNVTRLIDSDALTN